MSHSVQPAFGDFAFEANDCTIEEWREELAVRGAVSPIPRSDVARAIDGRLGARIVTVRGVVGPDGGGTRDQLRQATDALVWAHRPGFRALSRDSDRYLMAEVRSFTLGEDEGLSWVPFSVRYEAADPYWYGVSSSSDLWSSPVSGGTRTVTSGGSATAPPLVTVTVGSTGTLALDLYNDTLSESFRLAGAVTVGDVLVVDAAAQTVTRNGNLAMSLFEGSFWPLQPGPNVLRAVYSGASIATIQLDWTDRWL